MNKLHIENFPDKTPEELKYIIKVQWWTEAVIRMFLQLPISAYDNTDPNHHVGSIPLIMFHADFKIFIKILNDTVMVH